MDPTRTSCPTNNQKSWSDDENTNFFILCDDDDDDDDDDEMLECFLNYPASVSKEHPFALDYTKLLQKCKIMMPPNYKTLQANQTNSADS